MDKKLNEIRYDTEKATKYFSKIMAYTLGPAELKEMSKNHTEMIILDVRNKEDYDNAHIPNSISIPRSEMDERTNELCKEKLYVVYCYNQQCHLGACACRFLSANGYHAMLLEGGFKTWSEDFGFEVCKK